MAVTFVRPDGTERCLTWSQLTREADVAYRALLALRLRPGSLVCVQLPAAPEHVAVTLGAWRLGATMLALDPRMPQAELDRLVGVAKPALLVAARPSPACPSVTVAELLGGKEPSRSPEAPVGGTGTAAPALPRSAHTTGGTTGHPRVILRQHPWVYSSDLRSLPDDREFGVGLGERQLVAVPLHHVGFTRLYHGLALDHHVVVMEAFSPGLALELIHRHSISYFLVVPAMMRLILDCVADADLSSVQTVHISSAGCPEPVIRAWMRRFPPERVWYTYAMQERLGSVWIRGDEWLEHPGSVGRPRTCEVRIERPSGELARPNEVGEIFIRGEYSRQPRYLGSGPRLKEHDGFLSVGDFGHLDEDGYLYVLGRQAEMINVGGVKVFPAEVEQILLQHPGVTDAAVVGRPEPYLGEVVHALVVPRAPATSSLESSLITLCRGQLVEEKVPMSVEVMASIPRTSTGKLRRRDLVPGRVFSEPLST
ncbi:AMP-binding protein [Plantactinospora mayteni]|uniref:Acid-CoA ligase n=1 Tax=Plantactinospora mayteni TaxID=566021 RepID=A0ABQ4EIB8_9ACTN|nr:putative acid-CoA ligase [Plantactinospora mayteni]